VPSGWLDDARRWFVRALEMDPASSVVAFYLGETLLQSGLAEEALVSLQRAIQLNPENPDAHYLLGFIYWRHGTPGGCARGEQARRAAEPRRCRARRPICDRQVRSGGCTMVSAQRAQQRARCQR